MAAKQRKVNDSQTPKTPSTVRTDSSKLTANSEESGSVTTKSSTGSQPIWVVLAIASGACAAVNGVFAKLTTTSLTTTLATQLTTFLSLPPSSSNTVNMTLRGAFLGLNLLFNGVMWGLFTAALTKGTSTTRVSIVNVSANFLITAILGWAVFGERLPLGWWVGAGLLAVGNVIIGRREEEEDGGKGEAGGGGEKKRE